MKNKSKIIVTISTIIVGCLIVTLWFFLPLPFSVKKQAPITSKELFLLKFEKDINKMRILLALKSNLGFMEAQDTAEQIRDLCFDVDKEGWKKWSSISDDMHSWYIRLSVEETASLEEILDEVYIKYPFLKLEGVEDQDNFDNIIIKTPNPQITRTNSTTWEDIPGLVIIKKFTKSNILVAFEGNMVLNFSDKNNHSGFIRLLVDGKEVKVKEFKSQITSKGIFNQDFMTLNWKGELLEGKHTIKLQYKVSDSDANLEFKGIPKLVLIR